MTVDSYIESFPESVQERLRQVRAVVLENAPDAVEEIAYRMPAYRYKGKPLVYFAGYPQHIGFYATPTGHSRFSKELSKYKQGKGSVQFPLSEPLPLDLIAEMVRFRVEENSSPKAKSDVSLE